MLSIILRVIAVLLFVVAGCNKVLFDQPPVDLIAFGLAAWALGTLVNDPVILHYHTKG